MLKKHIKTTCGNPVNTYKSIKTKKLGIMARITQYILEKKGRKGKELE